MVAVLCVPCWAFALALLILQFPDPRNKDAPGIQGFRVSPPSLGEKVAHV